MPSLQVLLSTVSLLVIEMVLLTRVQKVSGSIITPPETTVGYIGHSVSFRCTVTVGHDIYWYLTNDHLTPNLLAGEPFRASTTRLDQPLNPTNFTSVLTIDASTATNNSLIICRAYSRNGNEYSTGVYPIVEGRLSPPGDVNSSINDDSVLFTWEPPFSQNPITSYNVNVSISGQTVTVATNSYRFMLSQYNVSRCYSDIEIVFEVCGLNPVGEGEVSAITVRVPRQHCTQVLQPVSSESPTVSAAPPNGHEMIIVYVTCAAVAVALSVALIVTVGVVCVCCLMCKKLNKNHVPAEPSFEMSQNPTYMVTKCSTQKNPAYTTVTVGVHVHEGDKHFYDTVGAPPVYATIGDLEANKYGEFQSA